MAEDEQSCQQCGGPVDPESGLCPECDEPAPGWMVWLVYVLMGFFMIGLIYRLIWP